MYIWRNKTNPCPLGDDATGRKRERDRAKRQAMAKEKKDEKNKVVLDKASIKHWEYKSWIIFKLLSLEM